MGKNKGICILISLLSFAWTKAEVSANDLEGYDYQSYTIQKGDTFSQIVHRRWDRQKKVRYQKFYQAHIALNREQIKNPSRIYAGREMIVLAPKSTNIPSLSEIAQQNRQLASVTLSKLSEQKPSSLPWTVGIRQNYLFQHELSKDLINASNGKLTADVLMTQLTVLRRISRRVGTWIRYEPTLISYRGAAKRSISSSKKYFHSVEFGGRLRLTQKGFLSFSYRFEQHPVPVAASQFSIGIQTASLHGASIGYHRLFLTQGKFLLSGRLHGGGFFPRKTAGQSVRLSGFGEIGVVLAYSLAESSFLSVFSSARYLFFRSNLLRQQNWRLGGGLGLSFVIN